MTPTPRPRTLPTVIGPTENALRALLVRLLAATPLGSYEQWAALNLADRGAGDEPALVGAVADGLATDVSTATGVLRALGDTGLLDRVDGTWRPSPAGAALLTRVRAHVAEATARVVDGLPEADVATAVRVLDHVRERAHAELTRLT